MQAIKSCILNPEAVNQQMVNFGTSQKDGDVIGADTNAASPEYEANPQDDMPATLLKPSLSTVNHSADVSMFKANKELQMMPQTGFTPSGMETFNGSAMTMDSSQAVSSAEAKQLPGCFDA